MDFLELARIRESVRSYSDTVVERKKLERCIEAARLAPSACNSQPWKFIIVDNPAQKEKVARATFGRVVSFNQFSLQAPVIVACISEPPNFPASIGELIKNKKYRWMDLGIAAEHFCLQATQEDLGTCILGWFEEKEIKKILEVPMKSKVGLLITVGYKKEETIRTKKRKTFSEICSYNKY